MPARNLAPPNARKTSSKSQAKIGRVLTTLGILTLTFGVFGWQWRAFSQRNQGVALENQPVDPGEDAPPADTHWHEAPKEVRLAVADCIRGQLSALQSDQYGAGLQYHTRAVRQQIPSTEAYRQLIQSRYPSIARHKRATFWFVNTDKKCHFANAGLTIMGRDGTTLEAVYQLVFQDKQWLISGIAKRPRHVLPSASKKP